MGEMRKLGREGDLKVSWNRDNEEEVEAAKKVFDEKIKAGWSAFMDKHGVKGDKIKIFDETAERIILVPRISGGRDEDEDKGRVEKSKKDRAAAEIVMESALLGAIASS